MLTQLSSTKMMDKVCSRSFDFVRHAYRFCIRSDRKNSKTTSAPTKNRKFRTKGTAHEVTQKTPSTTSRLIYWGALISVSFAIIVTSFSLIEKSEHFFVKGNSIYFPDAIKFLALPAILLIALVLYIGYHYIANIRRGHKTRKHHHHSPRIKHFRVKEKKSITTATKLIH